MEAGVDKEARTESRAECPVATVALMHSDDTHESLNKQWKERTCTFLDDQAIFCVRSDLRVLADLRNLEQGVPPDCHHLHGPLDFSERLA